VPKISSPASLSDFRPISITSVLSRAIERLVVRQFIYPALLTPPPSLVFSDQFAFRPSGSTTAAAIAILQTVTNLLSDHPYVIVISLDFSKAFDTVRHTTRFQKFAQLDIPDAVYNRTCWWIISPVTHTARITVARLPHCVRSWPALYRAQRLARCRMSSTLQIWGLWPQETSSVSMLMILTSSFQLPTSTLDAPSLTTYNTGQRRIT